MGANASKNLKLSNLPNTMKFRDFLLLLIENGVDGVDDIWWNEPDKSATVVFTAPEYAAIAKDRFICLSEFGGEEITVQLEKETATGGVGHIDARDPDITRGFQIGYLFPKFKLMEELKRKADSSLQKVANLRKTKSGETNPMADEIFENLNALKIAIAEKCQELEESEILKMKTNR